MSDAILMSFLSANCPLNSCDFLLIREQSLLGSQSQAEALLHVLQV